MRGVLGHITQLGFLLLLAGAQATAAPAPIDSDAIQIAPSAITYRARLGDTLSMIAERLTTKRSNWIALAKINAIRNDRAIPVGTAIVIPVALLLQDPGSAKVVALSGIVSATSADGKTSSLEIGSTLYEGTRIETGQNSFLTLALADESRIALPSNSQVKLTSLRNARYTKSPVTEITVLQGRVDSRVSSLKESKGRFEVRSPLAVAGVRGTNFRVDVSNNQMATEVLSGGVAVAQNNRPAALTLQPGQGNVTDAHGVGKAVKLLPEPEVSGGPALQERTTVRITVVPVPGARGYRTQIASDRAAQNILTEIDTGSGDIKIDGLADGNYFARMTAIDAQGLQGLPHVHAFKLKARPEPPLNIQPKGKTRSANLTFSWSEMLAAGSYHLQVATDDKFSNPVIDEATLTSAQFSTEKLPLGSYFWRVATVLNRDGKTDHGPFGDAQAFTLMTPVQLPKIDPAGNALAFSWQAEPGQKFVTEIARDAGFTSLFLTQATSAPEISIPNPPGGSYFIRIKAIDPDGYVGPFSAVQKIVVGSRWVTSDGSPLLNAGGITPAGH